MKIAPRRFTAFVSAAVVTVIVLISVFMVGCRGSTSRVLNVLVENTRLGPLPDDRTLAVFDEDGVLLGETRPEGSGVVSFDLGSPKRNLTVVFYVNYVTPTGATIRFVYSVSEAETGVPAYLPIHLGTHSPSTEAYASLEARLPAFSSGEGPASFVQLSVPCTSVVAPVTDGATDYRFPRAILNDCVTAQGTTSLLALPLDADRSALAYQYVPSIQLEPGEVSLLTTLGWNTDFTERTFNLTGMTSNFEKQPTQVVLDSGVPHQPLVLPVRSSATLRGDGTTTVVDDIRIPGALADNVVSSTHLFYPTGPVTSPRKILRFFIRGTSDLEGLNVDFSDAVAIEQASEQVTESDGSLRYSWQLQGADGSDSWRTADLARVTARWNAEDSVPVIWMAFTSPAAGEVTYPLPPDSVRTRFASRYEASRAESAAGSSLAVFTDLDRTSGVASGVPSEALLELQGHAFGGDDRHFTRGEKNRRIRLLEFY